MPALSATPQVICERDGCTNVVQAKRSTKRFCSPRCRALASNHTRTDQRNAVTSGNAKRRKPLTSGNETLTKRVPLADLIRQVERFYTPYQLQNDLDCVLSLCSSEAGKEEIIKAAKARVEKLGLRGVNAKVKLPPQRKGMTKAHARAITLRNVNHGKQGRCDLTALIGDDAGKADSYGAKP